MGTITQGTRVYPDDEGWLKAMDERVPATYGRATAARAVGTAAGWWLVRTPDGCCGSLNPAVHTVVEHEDGTITVTPSLDMSQQKPGAWHGWLRRGVFESV